MKIFDRSLLNFLCLLVVVSIGFFALKNNYPVLLFASWVVFVPFGHAHVMAFHESVHGTLGPNKTANEIKGWCLAVMLATPMSAYRVTHSTHHSSLGREDDQEMWPYNRTDLTKNVRRSVLLLELIFGFPCAVVLNWRGALKAEVSVNIKRRVLLEMLLVAGIWCCLILVLTYHGLGTAFLLCYLVPANLTGFFQSLRKFAEHLGMFGENPAEMTRTVLPRSAFESALCWINFYECMHAPHHMDATVCFRNLPTTTIGLHSSGKIKIQRSYWRALKEALPYFLDPKLGPSWK